MLLGADLRKPKIYMDFKLHNNVGLSNYLAGTASLEEITQHTGIDNFDIISGGPVPPNPSELLMSDTMTELIEKLQTKYQFVIIDTPPVGLVTDAFILMKHSNHNIYLVRQNYTPKETLRNVQDMVNKGKVEKISILFNDVQVQRYGLWLWLRIRLWLWLWLRLWLRLLRGGPKEENLPAKDIFKREGT